MKVTINNQGMAVSQFRYSNNHLGIELQLDDGFCSPFAHLSIFSDQPLGHCEFHVMPGHTVEFYNECLQTGLFKDTGKRVPHGFSHIHVWQIVEPNIEEPKTGPADIEEVIEATNELISAAKHVVESWESGDLAGAIRNLAVVASLTEYTLASVEDHPASKEDFDAVWQRVFAKTN